MIERPNHKDARAMIRHIVFFTFETTAAMDEARPHLERLADIPGSSVFEVRTNSKTDQIANDIDLIVYGEFADMDALQAYKSHPTYQDVTNIVQPMREYRFAADFMS